MVLITFTDPSLFSYDSEADRNKFKFDIDVRSLVVAASINSRTSYLESIKIIDGTNFTFFVEPSGEVYEGASYAHPKFPGMVPIVCSQSTAIDSFFCTVSLNWSFCFAFNNVPTLNLAQLR